jgi:hypothetical protein
MHYTGTVEGSAGARAIVKAVQGRRVVGQAELGSDGRWELDVDLVPDRIVVAERVGIAAVSALPERAAELSMPQRFSVALGTKRPPRGAFLALDPVELLGYPDGDLWILRARADGAIDLHVTEVEASREVTVGLQGGSYRLTGGVIGMPLGQPSWQVVEVVDEFGKRTPAHNGEVELSVGAASRYDVILAQL